MEKRNKINGHREEVVLNLSNIEEEHRRFGEEIDRQEDTYHPLLSRIDVWEQESIIRIQKTAETARIDVQQWIDRRKNELTIPFSTMTDEFRSSQESNDYTQIDLKRWMQQLDDLRKTLETATPIDLVDDDKEFSLIHLINVKVHQQSLLSSEENRRTSQPSLSLSQEKFGKIVGKMVLSDDGLKATCSGHYWDGSNISGVNQYSFGIHSIRFRIEQKSSDNFFFGIVTTAKEKNPWIRHTPSAYGWWDFNSYFNEEEIIRTGDEVTLTLDCDDREIQFEHHRTRYIARTSIQAKNCPFPWKIAVVLYSPGDCVKILH